ncbi:MAG: DUF4861 family protein, partial [Bacteroidales bacterium]|nr:DUF4861 family protein [Bacteroidales bacterium]
MLIIKIQRQIPAILGILILLGCNVRSFNKTIAFKNNLDIARLSETVTIPLDKLDMKAEEFKDGLFVKDLSSGAFRPTQFVDQDGDGTNDALVFQVDIPPLSTRNFELTSAKDIEIHQDTLVSTYSRFVPERIDDYAWENDRVAFRTYGPEAERLAKDGEGGGTLSSGIDCWLKRVDYPVIDKWYKMDAEGKGS